VSLLTHRMSLPPPDHSHKSSRGKVDLCAKLERTPRLCKHLRRLVVSPPLGSPDPAGGRPGPM
jgi:hypothetical protein